MEPEIVANENSKNHILKFRLLMVFWTLLMLAGIFVSAVFLRKNANPWALELKIPSELQKNHGINTNTSNPKLLDFSDDGNSLVISRNAMTADVWDINKKTRIAKLGKPFISEKNASNSEFSVPSYVAFLPDQKRILVVKEEDRYETHIYQYDVSGIENEICMNKDGSRGEVHSPKGRYIAFESWNKVGVIDANTGTLIKEFSIEKAGSNDCRIQWSNDESLLFFSGDQGFLLWDFEKDELLFSYSELDLNLPAPMIADENSGLKEAARKSMTKSRAESIEEYSWRRTHIANLEDSVLSSDGKHIAACYTGYSLSAGSETRRARLYGTRNGELLWDYIVEKGSPRSVRFSPDGSKLFIMIGSWLKEHRDALLIYDVASTKLLRNIELNQYKIHPSYNKNNFEVSSNLRKIAVFANPTVVLEVERENIFVPLRGLSSNVRNIAFSSDGNRIAAYDENSNVCVWRKTGEGSPYGAFARPELWLILLFSILFVIGLLVIKAEETRASINKPLPTALWIVVVLLGLAAALQLTECAAKIAIGNLLETGYSRIYPARHIACGIASFIWISLCVMLMKPRNGILYIYSVILSIVLWVIFGSLLFTNMSAPDNIAAARYGKTLRLLSYNFHISPRLLCNLIVVYIMLPVSVLLLIFRREVQKMMFLPNIKTRFSYLSHLPRQDK